MGLVKRLELVWKYFAGWLMACLWFRPFRTRRAAALLQQATDVFVVRCDNRVGEALLSTPLVTTLAQKYRVHLVLHQKCVRVLEGLPGVTSIHGVDPRDGAVGLLSSRVRALRSLTRGAIVINASNCEVYSGMQALLSRAISADACVIGPGIGPASILMDVVVERREQDVSELQQRLNLLSPLGLKPLAQMSFREPRESETVTKFVSALSGPFAVVNPGGRLGHRRVPVSVFKAAVSKLRAMHITPVVTWGPGEEALAREVCGGEGTLAPATTLDELAYLMKRSVRVVCNNTGPMHLSVAVGAKTLALFYRMPLERWGHSQSPHVMLDLTPAQNDDARMCELVTNALQQ